MIDIRQSRQYANYLSKIGWIVERIDNTNYFIKRLFLIGSILKLQRPEKLDLKTLTHLCKKYRVFQAIFEPKEPGVRFGKPHSPFLPTKTTTLDLTRSTAELIAGMAKDTRQTIKKFKSKKSKIKISKDMTAFRNAWKKAVGLRRYVPPLRDIEALRGSFANKSLFLLYGNTGAIFLTTDKVAYYWQAFTDKEGRKKGAQYRIVWEGIMWAKKKGCKMFDFEGIYDPRFPNKSWQGFTHFKKSFGGREVEYPGAYAKWCLPL